MDAGNPPVDPRGMRYPRAMPSALGAGLARGMRGVSTSRADTGLAVGFVPAGPRVAKLDRAWRWAAATQWPARRVVGCGGVAFGCTSWPACYPPRGGCAAGHAIPAPVGYLLPLTGKLEPGCAPLWLHAGGFVN